MARDGISPRGYLFIMLLAIQFGMQPLFTKTYVSRDADKVMLVLMYEVLECVIAIALTFSSKKGRESVGRFSLSDSLLQCCYSRRSVCISKYSHTDWISKCQRIAFQSVESNQDRVHGDCGILVHGQDTIESSNVCASHGTCCRCCSYSTERGSQ